MSTGIDVKKYALQRAEKITQTQKGGKNEQSFWALIEKYRVADVIEKKETAYLKQRTVKNITELKAGKGQVLITQLIDKLGDGIE